MGERGTDVAREAAALVLLDDSFARIVTAIRQGLRIYQNISSASCFVFSVHVPIIGLALVPALLQWLVLLLPVHILLLILANRNTLRVTGDGDNPWMKWMVFAVVLLLFFVVGLPSLRQIMGLAIPNLVVLIAIGLLAKRCFTNPSSVDAALQ